jgi:Phage integrase family
MPYEEVAAFIAKLREREATSALALELSILTAARSGEILGVRWSEVVPDKKIWTVPAGRMKAGREHRVPLAPRAVAILRQLEKVNTGEFVFPGQARNKPLSSMSMEMVLRRMKIENATVHGFRSSFRDWAGNVSSAPREVVETALAHVIGDKAEQAYRRSDALEKRRCQSCQFGRRQTTSGLPPGTDIVRPTRHVRKVPMTSGAISDFASCIRLTVILHRPRGNGHVASHEMPLRFCVRLKSLIVSTVFQAYKTDFGRLAQSTRFSSQLSRAEHLTLPRYEVAPLP